MPSEMRISQDGRRLTLGGNQATGFYDDTQLKIIELEFDQANYWDLLDEDTPASLRYDNDTYDGVGVRFKGATSDWANFTQKKSFNISIDYTDEDLDIEGYQTTNLNGGFQDPSNLREVLFNWVGRHYNPSLKSNFVHLYINGESWGAYSNVQQLNNDYIREWFMNDSGSRFRCIEPDFTGGGGGGPGGPGGPPSGGECSGGMGGGPGGGGGQGWSGGPSSLNYLGTDSTDYQENYLLKGSDREDPWSDLIQCIDRLNNLPENQLIDSLSTYFDIDKTLWYLAHEVMLTDEDGYIYKGRMDYYVYFDAHSEVLVPLEYDGNSTMEMSLVNWSPFQREDDECFPLMNRLMAVPAFRQRYLAHCRTIVNTYMDLDLIHNKIDFYANLINELEANDPVGDELFSYIEFLEGVEELKDFFEERRDVLLSYDAITREGVPIELVQYEVNGLVFEQPSETDDVVVTSTIGAGDVTRINLHYGTGFMGKFERTQMLDNGQNGDAAVGDGVYSATIPAFAKGQYVRYYVETIADDGFGTRTYSPEGAEHDVYLYQVKPAESVDDDVVINELMASNQATQTDEAGEFDDWIELFNTSTNEVDLSGYFVSDNPENLQKFELPAGTTIAGGGYLILWADEDQEQGDLHTNFKLSKNGETVYLLTPEGAIADEVTFGAQSDDLGHARQPNGVGSFVNKAPTFNSNNDATTNIQDAQFSSLDFKVFPNPAFDNIHISLERVNENTDIQIFNTLGQNIYHRSISQHQFSIDVAAWTKGLYFIKIGNVSKPVLIK